MRMARVASRTVQLVRVLIFCVATRPTSAVLTKSLRGQPPILVSRTDASGFAATLQQPGDVSAGLAFGNDGNSSGAAFVGGTAPIQPPNVFVKDSLLQDASNLADGVCDMTSTGGPVCFSERKAMLMPPATPHGLVGHWSFDGATAWDSSGNGNHAADQLIHGPSPAGFGHSAVFHKFFVTVPNSARLQLSAAFAVTFWVYVVEDDDGLSSEDSAQWCPLIRKGVQAATAREFHSSPAVLYSPSSGQLRASVTTTTHRMSVDGEFVDSNARLPPNRWAHVALVHHGSKLLLYVNGILDAVASIQGSVLPNQWPLYIGGDPFTMDSCFHTVYFDEVRVYDRAVAPHELQAEAAPALGGTDPSFVHLGCKACSLEVAARSCPATRHICSSLELHTGAYQVARSLGWLPAGGHVWTLAALKQQRDNAATTQAGVAAQATAGGSGLGMPVVGLGLCCEGPE